MNKKGMTLLESLLLGVAAILALGVIWYLLGSLDLDFSLNQGTNKGGIALGKNSAVEGQNAASSSSSTNGGEIIENDSKDSGDETDNEQPTNETPIVVEPPPPISGDACNNGVDDDNDGLVDFLEDPECESYNQQFEDGPSLNRPLYTTGETFASVCASGCKYKTIQEAVNNIPIFVLHRYEIDVRPGDYNENVRVPMFFGSMISPKGSQFSEEIRVPIQIHGPWNQWDKVKVNSFLVGSAQGQIPLQIAHLTVKDETPYGQARAGIEIYNSEEVTVDFVSFNKGVKNGVLCSRSRCYSDVVFAEAGNNIENMFLVEDNSYFSTFFDYDYTTYPSSIPGRLIKVENSIVNYDPKIPAGNYPVTASSGLYSSSGGIFIESETTKNPKVYGVSSASEFKQFIEGKLVDKIPRNSLFPDIDKYLVGKPSTLPNGRPLVSSAKKTIFVCSSGCDFSKLQTALDSIPLILKHDMTINIKDGVYNEDAIVPMFAGFGSKVKIIGNSVNPNNVVISSLMVDNVRGEDPLILEGFKTVRTVPYDDESRSLIIHGTEKVILNNLVVTNLNNGAKGDGFLCQSSNCYLNNINFGNNEVNEAMRVKHGGIIIEETPSSGNIFGPIYSGAHGFILAKSNSSNFANYTYPAIAQVNQGVVIDVVRNIGHNLDFKG